MSIVIGDGGLGRQINNPQSQSKISNRKNPQSSISTPQSTEARHRSIAECGMRIADLSDC